MFEWNWYSLSSVTVWLQKEREMHAIYRYFCAWSVNWQKCVYTFYIIVYVWFDMVLYVCLLLYLGYQILDMTKIQLTYFKSHNNSVWIEFRGGLRHALIVCVNFNQMVQFKENGNEKLRMGISQWKCESQVSMSVRFISIYENERAEKKFGYLSERARKKVWICGTNSTKGICIKWNQ